MSVAESTGGEGWLLPRLPDKRPAGLNAVVVLAYVANQTVEMKGIRHQTGCEMSYLFLQRLLGRSSDKPIKRVLSNLRVNDGVDQGWIVVASRSSLARGTHYKLGPLSLADQNQWESIGDRLLGPNGILAPFLWSPATLSLKGFGLNGCLVLAAVNELGPTTDLSIVRELEGYVSRNTVERKIQDLVGLELIEKSQGTLSVVEDIWSHLAIVLRRSGAEQRHRDLARSVRRTQALHQERVLGELTLRRYKADLRKMACVYCGCNPEENGQVEHYPPRYWGGTDADSLLLPSCGTCNGTLGGRLRHQPRRAFDRDGIEVIVFPGTGEELATWVVQLMLLEAQREARLGRCGTQTPGEPSDSVAFAVLAALRNGVVVIDSRTGESRQFRIRSSIDWLLSQIDGLTGLARSC